MPSTEDSERLIESLISSYKSRIPESTERNVQHQPPESVKEQQAEAVPSSREPTTTLPSIAELTRQCVSVFEICVRYESLMNHQWAENRFADFNLFVDGVGALAASKGSLDSRFESRQDDLVLVQNVLTMLKSFLAECISCAEAQSSTDAATMKVDSSLENLALMAVAIRKTGKRSRLSRADDRFNPAEHEDLEALLRVICLRQNTSNDFGIEVGKKPRSDGFKFETLSTQEIVKTSKEAQLSEAQQRLIEVNLRRRNRFLRAQEHSEKLKAHQSEKQEIMRDTQGELDDETHLIPNMDPLSLENSERSQTRDLGERHIQPAFTIAKTKASTAEGIIQVRKAKKAASQPAMTAMTALTATINYPKAPDACRKSTMFKCPCCCQTLPAEFGTDEDLWKKHLAEDISPYTCILPDCPTPFATFTTVSDWEKHFQREHRPCRVCPLCANADAVFSGMEGLASHIETEHAEVASPDFVQTVISWSGVTTIGISHCPLCDSTGPEHAPEFVRHVLGCIHDFSLYSLPWAGHGQDGATQHVWVCKPETIGDGDCPMRRWLENRDDEGVEASGIELDHREWDRVKAQGNHLTNYYFDERESEFFGIASAQDSLKVFKQGIGSSDYLNESENEFFDIASAQNSLEAFKRGLGSSDHLDESERELVESSHQNLNIPVTNNQNISAPYSITPPKIKATGGKYSTRNAPGEDFRQILQVYGDKGPSFIARAEMLLVCSGKLRDGGNGTLIIFRFTFLTYETDPERRFTSAKISVQFSDLLGRMASDPEVETIWPGSQGFSITTHHRDFELGFYKNAGGSLGVDIGDGAKLTFSRTMTKDYTWLRGVQRNNRANFMGADNEVIWRLNEHPLKKQGVPNFLQTAVLLRRKNENKFQMKINIETTVDRWTSTKQSIRNLFGKVQTGPAEPVNIDSTLFMSRGIDIPELEEKRMGGEVILDALDISDYVGLRWVEQ